MKPRPLISRKSRLPFFIHVLVAYSVIHLVLGLRSMADDMRARAHDAPLHFSFPMSLFPKIELPSTGRKYWKLSGTDTEYKNDILRTFQDKLTGIGIPAKDQRVYVAQLYHENGTLSPERLGDKGCSFGIIQYNACSKKGMSASSYLRKHPEAKTVSWQLDWIVGEISKRQSYGTIRQRIVAHNCPACAQASVDACYVGGVRQKTCYFQRIVKASESLSM